MSLLPLAILLGGCTPPIAAADGAQGGSGNLVGGSMPAAGQGGASVAGGAGSCAPTTPKRIWRLSDEQYANAVSDLLPGVSVPAITTPGRQAGEFINLAERFPVTGSLASSLSASVKSVAAASVQDLTGLLQCQAGQAPDACVGAFIDRFVPRAFRRPLDSTERQALLNVYAVGAKASPSAGVRLVLEAVLQAPSFLYRRELGGTEANTTLNAYELATSLSFLLINSGPDDELWRVAQDGSLSKFEVLQQQTDRLLGTKRAQDNIARMYLKWLGLGAGVTTELPPDSYPEYDDALRRSLFEESSRFIAGLVTKGGTLSDLLTSRTTFVDQRLAELYGVPYTGSGDFVETKLPETERAGVLTQAGVLVSKSRGHQIVIRGKFVRRDLFCQDIPPPPPSINIQQFSNLGLSDREESTKRIGDPVCGQCHKLMDPIGVSFEKYDALGRYRPNAADNIPVESLGALTGTDVDGTLADPVDLAERLGRSAQARSCISQNTVGYAFGREPGAASECEQAQIFAAVEASGARLTDLVRAVALSPLFAARVGGP
jgi:Protein of unknown function (DUF1592)/Protein of unknown function (DUF1588)/Protein of unknown function (DUF1595)/Protein of unknown function (DUF1585)